MRNQDGEGRLLENGERQPALLRREGEGGRRLARGKREDEDEDMDG